MSENKWSIKDFDFPSKTEYEEAKKEVEAVDYIKANTNFSNPDSVLKLYNKLISQQSFKTMIGYEFLLTLRRHIIKKGILPEENVQLIPVEKVVKKEEKKNLGAIDYEKEMKKYQILYENLKAKKTSSNIVIVSLVIIIGIMIGVALLSDNSVISDYENRIIDKYEDWRHQLEEKEKELEEREKNLKKAE